jgi:hypothetical protein
MEPTTETTTDSTDAEPEVPEQRGADQFVRDPRTEKILLDNHLKFDFVVYDIDTIDLSALDQGEPDRQMRDEVIHMDVAQRYADDLGWGSQFPAGVLSKSRKKAKVVDFHHRLWAARVAKFTQVSAYVVPELEDFDLIELGNLLNRNHGVPLSEHERIRQALWGLDLGRFKNVRQAARVLGIPESKVGKAKRIREARALAAEAGVSAIAFERLPKASQERLGSIDSPEVFREAANSVINKGLGTTEVNELVTKVNEVGGDVAKIDVVKAFAADIEPKVAPISNLADPWFRVHTACRALLAVEIGAEFDLSLRRRSASDLSVLFGEVTDVTEKLATIKARLDAIESADDTPQADAG